jgi:hypothetical protein
MNINIYKKILIHFLNIWDMNYMDIYNCLQRYKLYQHNILKQDKIYRKKNKKYIILMILVNGNYLVKNKKI